MLLIADLSSIISCWVQVSNWDSSAWFSTISQVAVRTSGFQSSADEAWGSGRTGGGAGSMIIPGELG